MSRPGEPFDPKRTMQVDVPDLEVVHDEADAEAPAPSVPEPVRKGPPPLPVQVARPTGSTTTARKLGRVAVLLAMLALAAFGGRMFANYVAGQRAPANVVAPGPPAPAAPAATAASPTSTAAPQATMELPPMEIR